MQLYLQLNYGIILIVYCRVSWSLDLWPFDRKFGSRNWNGLLNIFQSSYDIVGLKYVAIKYDFFT